MKLVVALLTIIIQVAFVSAQVRRPPVVKVSESKILIDIAERKKQQTGITAKELAAYANELLEKRGFDFHFDVCDLLSARDRMSTAEWLPKRYSASLTDDRRLTLKLDVLNPEEALCGECWLFMPSRRVTKRDIHFIAEGKTYRLRRTPLFYLDEAQLVDSSLKKVLRRWELPYPAVPTGISPDGTKLYIDFYVGSEIEDDLALEISEDGTVAFRDRAGLRLRQGTWIENFPKDPKNDYLSFMKFEAANKTYIIRFTAPCT